MDMNRDTETERKPEDNIKIDGYAQVLEMLQIADESFRESLLRRLAARDRNLAAQLRQQLAEGDF